MRAISITSTSPCVLRWEGLSLRLMSWEGLRGWLAGRAGPPGYFDSNGKPVAAKAAVLALHQLAAKTKRR